MYVVVEFNQASRQPSIADDTVYYRLAEARSFAAVLAKEIHRVGRRERFEVYELTEVED